MTSDVIWISALFLGLSSSINGTSLRILAQTVMFMDVSITAP